MPNLDNIFNKFFPQSQTGSKGKFLIRMAWAVEILVAFIGLCIGIIVIRGAQGVTEASDLISKGISLNDLTIGMIFIIVAVVELTKIPLATAVYYSVRVFWRVVFLIALLLVNISTFETIVTGFERINREIVRKVDKKIVEYNFIKKEIQDIRANTDINSLNEEIEKLRAERRKINEDISKIKIDNTKEKLSIKNLGGNQELIAQLTKEVEALDIKIEKLRDRNSEINSTLKDLSVWKSKKDYRDEKDRNNKLIDSHLKNKENKESNLKRIISEGQGNTENDLALIDDKTKVLLKPYEEELTILSNKINDLENRQKNFNTDKKDKDEKLIKLKNQKSALISNSEGTGIDDLAPEVQVYRVATWLKGWFKVDYNKEIERINLQVFELEQQKVNSITEKGWFDKLFSVFNKNQELDNEAIDKQILRLENQIKDFEYKSDIASVNIEESIYADLPQGAITAAFWLWFGVLSFIISVTGTMLAFASLVLLDPRLHTIRNKKTAYWRGVSIRLSKFFVLVNKYIWGKIKRFRDPNIKIVEKEVEVEKVVEKIVEKNIGEKIKYEKVEVPKEVVRKEMVYVPLPTDDEELLKRGPFTSVDKDKKK